MRKQKGPGVTEVPLDLKSLQFCDKILDSLDPKSKNISTLWIERGSKQKRTTKT